MSTNVEIFQGDDWIGIYVENELAYQGAWPLTVWEVARVFDGLTGRLSVDAHTADDIIAYIDIHHEFPHYVGTLHAWLDEYEG